MASQPVIPNIKKGKLTEQIFEHLKALILSGKWPEGYHIPSEDELAASFGVSRMSVRAALQKLELLGLIEIKVGHGSIVTQFSLADYMSQIGDILLRDSTILEVVQFRFAYEMEAIRLTIQRATNEQMEHLHRLFDELVAALQEKKINSYMECTYNFFHYICIASGNSLFIGMDNALKEHLLSTFNYFGDPFENCEERIEYIFSLLCAIEARDVDKATSIYNDRINTCLYNKSRQRDIIPF